MLPDDICISWELAVPKWFSKVKIENLTRTEAKRGFYELRKQADDVSEMSLAEINAEISAVRAERKR